MSDLKTLITKEFDAAWNAHDVDRVLTFFADDAVVQTIPTLPGAPPAFEGKEQIRMFVEELMPGFRVESSDVHAQDDRVRWFSKISSDSFSRMGVDLVECTSEALVEGGRIVAFTPRFTSSSIAKLMEAQQASGDGAV